MKHFGVSDVGRRRSNNEDAFLALDAPPLWVVSDGVGGGPDGEVASRCVVQGAEFAVEQGARGGSLLDHCVRRASECMAAYGPSNNGEMGATFVAATLHNGRLIVGTLGDSRAYLLTHPGKLHQLTQDHTIAHMLSRWVGPSTSWSPDLFELDPPQGRLLLCSDGVHGLITPDAMQTILRDAGSPRIAAQKIIDASLEAGGTDNATAIVVFL